MHKKWWQNHIFVTENITVGDETSANEKTSTNE